MRAEPGIVLAIVMTLTGCATTGEPTATPENIDQAASLNLQLGIGYMQKGLLDVALEKLKKAISFEPDYPEAYNALGVLYEQLDEPALAEAHYLKAMTLNTQYGLARLNHGRLLCQRGATAEGEAQILDTLRSMPLDSPDSAYIGAGECRLEQGDTDQAERYFRRALELNPNAGEALLAMARLSYNRSELLPSRAFLNRYHNVASFSAASLALGIEIEQALGDTKTSRQYRQLLTRQFADSVEARQVGMP